jgi:signal transduction histidine kinase
MADHHILVAEPDPERGRKLEQILRALPGRSVTCSIAENGQRALALAGNGSSLDLVVVERKLPDMDGLELVKELRRARPWVECIVVSAEVELDAGVESLGHGVFAYVKRPVVASTLLQSAEAALAKFDLWREREELRRELESSERRHREIVQAMPAFVLVADGEGRIQYWNERLEDLTGRFRSQMLGTDMREVVGDGGERPLLTKRGTRRFVRWHLTRHRNGGGELVTYALGTDVTEEKAMLKRTLRAERLAAVGRLATGLAHEVRNPLNSATLQLQVLRRRMEKDGCDPALHPIVDAVGAEIQRLERLVGDFLAFARPLPLHPKRTSALALLTATADGIRAEASASGISVRVLADASVEAMDADPERLQQALCNLAKNAVEAMPAGGTLTLSADVADPEGYVAIHVEDTGAGIPEDAPVFDAFFTTKPQGTGLGLAIVHRIVEEHGGTIHYESRPGATRFTLKLPCVSELTS